MSDINLELGLNEEGGKDGKDGRDGKMHKQSRGKYVNKSIQTDYRDSECQTDPYSPPYFLPYPG